jgi:short-subunit dehydrogenase
MRERGGGRVANIASIGGLVAVPHLLPYSASKFALVGLSQGMHAELAREGILVSTIAPGLMRTGSPRNALFKGAREQEYAWFAISDSLPLLSMSATRAARRIVQAIERGEARVVLGLPAKIAALAAGAGRRASLRGSRPSSRR